MALGVGNFRFERSALGSNLVHRGHLSGHVHCWEPNEVYIYNGSVKF